MDIIQKTLDLNFAFDKNSNIERLGKIFKDQPLIRFAISDENTCEYSELSSNNPNLTSIFDFNPRKYVNNEKFNAVMIIPTGIGAETGGDSGDACVNARLIGTIVDNLITHPNVVNAADFNEMTPNTLYVEGSLLNRFMLGTVGLSKSSGSELPIS